MDYSIIKKIADTKKMSIRSLCIKAKITEAGYYKMVSHRSMKIENLENIAKALKVSPGVFFGLEDNYTTSIVSEETKKYNQCEKCKRYETSIDNQNMLIKKLTDEINDCNKKLEKRKAG